MNLYRLDPAEPTDPLWRVLNGERGAVRAAMARAKRIGKDVTVSRIDGKTLRVRPCYRANAQGVGRRVR